MRYRGIVASKHCTCMKFPETDVMSGVLDRECPEHKEANALAWELYKEKVKGSKRPGSE